MATQKQIQANQINAPKGGVKTQAGKIAVRLNAVSHGLFSKDVLLPGENAAQLYALCQHYMLECQPVGEMENFLVERIVTNTWRLKRPIRTEKTQTKDGGDYRFGSWQVYMRYETALERQIYKALHELQKIRHARLSIEAALAMVSQANEADRPSPEPASPTNENNPHLGLPAGSSRLNDFFAKHSQLIYDQSAT